jgi:hypothetical protein
MGGLRRGLDTARPPWALLRAPSTPGGPSGRPERSVVDRLPDAFSSLDARDVVVSQPNAQRTPQEFPPGPLLDRRECPRRSRSVAREHFQRLGDGAPSAEQAEGVHDPTRGVP